MWGHLDGTFGRTVLRYQMDDMYNMMLSHNFISRAALKSVRFSVKLK